MPQLIISFEGDYPKVVDLESEEIAIGRHSENDIQIPFKFISSFHAQLNREPNGDYRLTDRDSHNGTFVNGNALGGALLEDGDQISFGAIRATYRVGARKIEKPKVDTPKVRSLSESPIQATAPIAIPKPGELQGLTEIEVQIQLREKAQKQIDKEFEEEKQRIEELKRLSAELEEANAGARAKFEKSQSELGKIEKAAGEHQSHMAMSEHLVRDLEKVRENEKAKFAEAQAGKEALERDQKILQHELGVGRKELENIKAQLAESKGNAEKAETTFKQLVEYETKTVRLDTEIVTKEKSVSDLDRTLSEKREQLAQTEKEFEEKRREIDEMGGVKLVDLKKEIEELEYNLHEKKSSLDNLTDETSKAEWCKGEAVAELEDAQGKLEEARRSLATQEKELEEHRARLEALARECEENASRKTAFAEERKKLEEEIARGNRERDEIRAKIEEDRKAASEAESERKIIEELHESRKQAENDLNALRDQVASLDKGLAAKRQNLAEVEESIEHGKGELEEISSVELVELRSEGDEVRKEAEENRARLESVKRELEELEKSRDERASNRKEKDEELRKLKEECEKRAAELGELDGKADKLRADREAANKELAAARSELENTRIQVDDQKKIASKIATELRTLEERKSTNAKLESDIASQLSRLKEIEAEVAGRRQNLRQVEKELTLREKWLRKSRKGSRFGFASVLPSRNAKLGSRDGDTDDDAKRAGIADDNADDQLARAGAEKENLEQENRKLSQLIAEKTAALQQLEEEFGEHRKRNEALNEADKNPSQGLTPQLSSEARNGSNGKDHGNRGGGSGESKSEGAGKNESKNESKNEGKNEGESKDKVERIPADANGIELLNSGTSPGSDAAKKDDNKDAAIESKADAGKNGENKNRVTAGPVRTIFPSVPRKKEVVAKPRGDQENTKSDNGRENTLAAIVETGSIEKDVLPIRIIHPRNREMNHYYPDGAGSFDPERHPPIGFHALAACTKGSVHRTAESLPSGEFAALILLSGSLDKDREIIEHISREIKDKPLLACWREGALDKLAAQLEGGAAFQQFTDMLGNIDGLISTDNRTSSLLSELQVVRRCLNVPLPYPVDAKNWNFSIPLHERDQAIFVSADGFDRDSAEHRARIELVNTMAEKHRLRVTLYHHLPEIIENLAVPADLLDEPNKTLNYGEFLSTMAKHRFVVGFGRNMAGGEVWGDALLTQSVYLGGHGKMESMLFPDSSFTGGEKKDQEDLLQKIAVLLQDSKAFEDSVAETRRSALDKVSFGACRSRIADFLGAISGELLTIS